MHYPPLPPNQSLEILLTKTHFIKEKENPISFSPAISFEAYSLISVNIVRFLLDPKLTEKLHMEYHYMKIIIKRKRVYR